MSELTDDLARVRGLGAAMGATPELIEQWRKECCDFVSKHAAAIEAMERDAGRLDWLMEQAAVVKTDGSGGWYVYFDWLPEDKQYGPRADSRRAAIDAAMEAGR